VSKSKTGKTPPNAGAPAAPAALAASLPPPPPPKCGEGSGVTKADASPSQFNLYIDAQFQAESALAEGVSLLESRLKQTGDPQERSIILTQIGGLQTQLQILRADRTAFMAESLVVCPPTADDLEQLKQIADSLDKLVASSTTATAILKLATEAADIWQKTRPS
jgi:hypothetical protein